jgi:phage/plasmid-like protein (TIGR03299 family)
MVETMAYAGEVPWHRLGVKVDDDMTPEQMLVAAGLDWEVHTRRLRAQNGSNGQFSLNMDHKALVRDSDESILGICGPSYRPVQNRDAIDFFKRFTNAGTMSMETAGSLDSGRRIWALANIKHSFNLGEDDVVNGYILLSNPHIWGKSMNIMFTPVRVVCNNTLTMAMSSGGDRFSHPHVKAFDEDVQEKAMETVGISEILMQNFKQDAEILAGTKISEEDTHKYLTSLFQKDLIDQAGIDPKEYNRTVKQMFTLIDHQPGAKFASSEGTYWGAFNAVTYFYDHIYGREDDSRLTQAWFGNNGAKKRSAMNLALDMAKAA